MEVYRRRVESAPENELFRFSLAKALYDAGEYQESVAHFEKALARKPDWMLVAILLGKTWLKLGDRERAIHFLRMGQTLAREQNHEGPLEEVTALLEDLHRRPVE
jgi:tetratricopeptide (TPR) repeat protein